MNHEKEKFQLTNWEIVSVNPIDKNWKWTDFFCFWAVNIQSLIGFSLIASLYIIYDLNFYIVLSGSILFGFATPTEAAGCGAMGALLLSLAYKKLTLPKLQDALVKTLEITALIMVLVAASNFFGAVFARLGTPTLLTEFLLG